MSRPLVWLTMSLLLGGCEEGALEFPASVPVDLPFAVEAGLTAKPRLVDAHQFLQSTPVERALAALVTDPVRGNIRIVHGPTSCQPQHGVNPGIRPQWQEPRVGREIRIVWTTRACTMPPPPEDLALLIVSLSALPTAMPLAASGCSLLITPEYVMLPSFSPNAVLQREPGRGIISLNWTPDAGWVGRSLWSQLVVFAPGENSAGYLMSPALELYIGSALGT
ncbi:MAG TPA: hypothetical protein VFZ65_17005 [Planctomycetota bacterium]|nr:hypothetical protein [Planctomycetota bacterium]